MDIKWLKTFIAAANYENFRKASEELFLTQPAVTKHIKKLEEHLHIQLFERKGKHVFLTSAGITFLSSAVEIVEKYEEEMERFEGWKQGYHRKLTIAAAPQIAASVLPSFLRSFIHDYPNIEVIVNVVSSFKIGEEISSGQADIGLTRLKPIQMEICCETVHEERVIFVAPYREKANRNEKEVLHSYRLLTNNHPAYWEPLLRNIKKHYPRTRIMPVTQVEVTKKMIEEGLGVSYLPLSMIEEELQNKRVLEIQPDNVIPPNSFTYVVTKIETPEVKQFKQSLIASFSKNG